MMPALLVTIYLPLHDLRSRHFYSSALAGLDTDLIDDPEEHPHQVHRAATGASPHALAFLHPRTRTAPFRRCSVD